MINFPHLKVLLEYLSPEQIPVIKAGLAGIKYPSKVKGLRFNVGFSDTSPDIIAGLKIFEAFRPAGTTRLMSLPNVFTAPSVNSALQMIFAAMKATGTTPLQWQYHLNESWQPCYGLTPGQAIDSANRYRSMLDKAGLSNRKLYLCCIADATWKSYMLLTWKGVPAPRDLHFYHDADDAQALYMHILTAEECLKYTKDVICTEAGYWESKTKWGDWDCWNFSKAIIPLRSVIAVASKYSNDVAYHNVFEMQTVQPPFGAGSSIGLFSNRKKQDTPRVHPILEWLK